MTPGLPSFTPYILLSNIKEETLPPPWWWDPRSPSSHQPCPHGWGQQCGAQPRRESHGELSVPQDTSAGARKRDGSTILWLQHPCHAASCHPRTGPHETAAPRVNGARWEGLPLRTAPGLGTAGRDRWAQVALGRTLSPSSRNRSPERGAGDVQRRGDGFSHALFPCPNPSPCSTRGVISDGVADSELSGSPGGTTRCPEGRRAPCEPRLCLSLLSCGPTGSP